MTRLRAGILAVLAAELVFAAGYFVGSWVHRALVLEVDCTAAPPAAPSVRTGATAAQEKAVVIDLSLGVDKDEAIENAVAEVLQANLPHYPTRDKAAMAAAQKLYDCSHHYECSIDIAERHGKYLNSLTHSDAMSAAVEVGRDPPTGYKLVATIHAHPCLNKTYVPSFYSRNDLIIAIVNHLPSYLLDQCTGRVSIFDPAVDKPATERINTDQGEQWSTHGRTVGHIKVSGKSVEPNVGPQ